MSQKATRKSHTATTATEEKEKVDTPVKEMKKKIAANAEKQAAEKSDKPAEKSDKNDATDKSKTTEKPDKNGEKSDAQNKQFADKKTDTPKDKQPDKKTDKQEKVAEKKQEKVAEKKQEKVAEKKQEKSDKKTEKPAEKKPEAPAEKDGKADKTKEKPPKAVNGTHNGAANGTDHGTVSDDSDVELVMEEDELFPELTYDDSGTDGDEPLSRSHTRRSQVKPTKTPETPAPRPASDHNDDSKESKLLKLKDDTIAPSDRKLRSADSPKPDAKKLEKKPQESPKKQDSAQEEEKSTKKDLEASKKEQEKEADKKEKKDSAEEKSEKIEVEVVVEVDSSENALPRTRARVSPYSRTRLDRTTTSVTADYTGNNSTMEMDITESSISEEPALNDSAYLRGLRGIRGRTSYKKLGELTLTHTHNRTHTQAAPVRPLGAVVGRKRKPSPSPPASPARADCSAALEASEDMFSAHTKRMKLFDRLAMPFRRGVNRRAAEIVGINTDLPLTAPVASASFASFDPETIKAAPAPAPGEPLATPLPAPAPGAHDRDGKRCAVM